MASGAGLVRNPNLQCAARLDGTGLVVMLPGQFGNLFGSLTQRVRGSCFAVAKLPVTLSLGIKQNLFGTPLGGPLSGQPHSLTQNQSVAGPRILSRGQSISLAKSDSRPITER